MPKEPIYHFFIYKTSAVSNILDLDNFIKMDALCGVEGIFIESVIGALIMEAHCVEGAC
jgi:hypothetical protein